MQSIKTFIPLLLATSVLILTGCEANSPEDDQAMIMLDLEPMIGTQSLAENTVYTLNGQKMTFTSARMYLSEIVLIQDDGTEMTFAETSITAPAKNDADETVTHTTNDRIVLAKHDAGEQAYSLGEVPAGTYKGVRFKIGVSGLTNKMDPTQIPATHALTKQTDRNNHWSWNSGYIFLRLDGYLDLDGDGAVEETEDSLWDVHIGTANFAQVIQLDETFSLSGGEMQNLHITVDYAKMLANVDLSDPDQRRCHTMDNLPVAQKVAADMSSAFMLHGIHSANHSN